MKKPLVSIIVLNWNGKKFVDPFVRSVMALEKDTYELEVLFTDNASSDGSPEYYCEKYEDGSTFKFLQNGNNYGYAKGNNLGMRHATGQYILVCNNDLELDSRAVEELLKVSREKDADLVVPKLMFLNREGIINNAGSKLRPQSNWPIEEIGANQKDEGQFDDDAEITAFCGACVLFKRSFLETIGMYDSRFFMYFEDGDLSWRGQTAGKHYYYAPKAVAHHYHTGSSKEGSPLFVHYVSRNRILIITKNARLRIIASVWKVTLHDHAVVRIRNLLQGIIGRYPMRTASIEAYRSARLIVSAILLTPYCLAKRYKIIKEQTL